MKHIYKNLMIWVVSLFGMSLTAQTVADKHKAMLPQSGKLQWEKPVKAMIKPQMPVTRMTHDRMNLPVTSRTASLRAATVQTMQLDSIIYCSPEGVKERKYIYRFNKEGKEIERLLYRWNNSNWNLSRRLSFAYDTNGNCIADSTFNFENSQWILSQENSYIYDNQNLLINQTSTHYSPDGQIYAQSYEEYNSYGNQTLFEYKELQNGVLTPTMKSKSVYNSQNWLTHSEMQAVDDHGEWYYTSYLNYNYDAKNRQTLYETYDWDISIKKLVLTEGRYAEYNDQDIQTYYETKKWNGKQYERDLIKTEYSKEGMKIYNEVLNDNSYIYSHHIEKYTYSDDLLAGTSFACDTSIIKEDGYENTSLNSSDYVFDKKRNKLSQAVYNVDPETKERLDRFVYKEYTYDILDRVVTQTSTYFANGQITSCSKVEYERPEKGESYIQSNYEQDLETEKWSLVSKSRYEYEQMGEDSYYFKDSYWNMVTQTWIVTNGYKYEYEFNNQKYEQIESVWDTDLNNWRIINGVKNIEERTGENHTIINAFYNIEIQEWMITYSDKLEIIEGNPKVGKLYRLPENSFEDWQLYSILYYYYSESSVANEAIDAVDARIYTRPGTIHVDMEGKAALSVYAANGACCYQSSISGSTDVSNLQRGIYFVVLQSDSGTKKVKVLVK